MEQGNKPLLSDEEVELNKPLISDEEVELPTLKKKVSSEATSGEYLATPLQKASTSQSGKPVMGFSEIPREKKVNRSGYLGEDEPVENFANANKAIESGEIQKIKTVSQEEYMRIKPEQKKVLKSFAFDINEAKRKAVEEPLKPIPLSKEEAFKQVNLLEKRQLAVNSLAKGQEQLAKKTSNELTSLQQVITKGQEDINKLSSEGRKQEADSLWNSLQPTIYQFKEKEKELNSRLAKLNYYDKRAKATDQEMINISEGQQSINNQWDRLNAGLSTLSANILRSPQFAYNTLITAQNKIAREIGLPEAPYQEEGYLSNMAKYFEQNADAYHKVVEKKQKQADYDIISLFKKGENAKALNLLLENIVESAPTTGAIAMGGVAGLTNLGTTIGGGLVFGAGTFEENKKKGIDDATNVVNSWTNGLLEGIFESTGTLSIINDAKNIFVKSGKEAVEESAKNIWQKVYGKAAEKLFPVTSAVKEGISEGETTFTQNIVNIVQGVDEEYNKKYQEIANSDLDEESKNQALSELTKEAMFKGVPDAFLTGVGMGAILGGGAKKGYVAVDDKNRKEVEEAKKKFNEYATTLTNPTVSAEAKELIQQKAKEEADKIVAIQEQDDNDLKQKLTKKDYEAVVEIQSKISNLEKSIDNIDNEQSKAVVYEQVNELNKEKAEILKREIKQENEIRSTDNNIPKQVESPQQEIKPTPIEVIAGKEQGDGSVAKVVQGDGQGELDTKNAKPIEEVAITDINKGDVVIGYHSTPSGDIDTGNELGIHIGTKDVAENINSGKRNGNGIVKKIAFKPNKPLILGDMPSWSSINVLGELLRQKFTGINKEKLKEIRDSDFSEKEKQKQIIDLIKGQGFDAVAYQNFDEGNGEYSYILFDKSQLNELEEKAVGENVEVVTPKETPQEVSVDVGGEVAKGDNPRGGTWEEVITDKDGLKTTKFKGTRVNKNGELVEVETGRAGREMTWDDFLNEFAPNDIDLEAITDRGTPESVTIKELREGADGRNAMTVTVDWGKSERGINETSTREVKFDRVKPITPQAGSVGVGGDVEATAKALEDLSKNKTERFYPDDKVILTTKDGKEVEVSFRGYNGEKKAVIFGSRGSGINQMEVDVSQLRAKNKSDKLTKDERKNLLSKIDFQDKEAPAYKEDFTDKELQDLSVRYPKRDKLSNKEKNDFNDFQIATTPLKKWQEQEYGVDDPLDPTNIKLAKEHETAINNIIDNDKFSTLLAEAYHKAKADGSNPELIKAVEQSLKETPQEVKVSTPEKVQEEVGNGQNDEKLLKSPTPNQILENIDTYSKNQLISILKQHDRNGDYNNASYEEAKALVVDIFNSKDYSVLDKQSKLKWLNIPVDKEAKIIKAPFKKQEDESTIAKIKEYNGVDIVEGETFMDTSGSEYRIEKVNENGDIEIVSLIDDEYNFFNGKNTINLSNNNVFDIFYKPIKVAEEKTLEEAKPLTKEEIQAEEEQDEMLLSGESDKRRRQGKFTKDGITYVRQKETEGVEGSQDEVVFAKGVTKKFKYKVIDRSQLQPSHLGGLRNSMHFIPEAQPKRRTDSGSIAAEQTIANNPNLKIAGENTNAYSGAPVVNKRGEVIQGNNRAAGLVKAYKQGTASNYKQDLINNAEKYGMTKEQVEAMEEPVLVRELDVNDTESIELGNYEFNDIETGNVGTINPVKIVSRMTKKIKEALVREAFKGEYGTTNESIRGNFDAIEELLVRYLNVSQYQALRDSNKNPSTKGIEAVNTLLQRLVFDGGDVALSDMFEGLPPSKQNTILKAAVSIISLPTDITLLQEFQNAIVGFSNFVSRGAKSVDAWSKEYDAFTNSSPRDIYTPLELEMIRLLSEKPQSEFSKMFKDYSVLVKGKKAEGMWGEDVAPITKAEAVENIFKIKQDEQQSKESGTGSPKKVSGEKAEQKQPQTPTEKAIDVYKRLSENNDTSTRKEYKALPESIKRVLDNIVNIHQQLEQKKIITKIGNCP